MPPQSRSGRYLLHPKIRDEFLDIVQGKATKLFIGPGLDNPDLGPIVSDEQYARVTGYVAQGVQAPTGGIKDSGIGRERGLAGIRNYLQIKNVAIRL